MNPLEVERAIAAAFQGVSLGGGCRLRSAEEAHQWGQPPFTDPAAYRDVEVLARVFVSNTT